MNHGKHGNHTMIMSWIMTTMTRNMPAMSPAWHNHGHVSPWSWQYHGMAAMFFQPGEGWKHIFKKYYHIIRILQQICYLKRLLKNSRFFSKNPSIFFKKPKFWTFWEILLFQSHSTANLLQFVEKNDIHTREQPMLARLRELNWQASGKKTHLFEKILLSIF